MVGTGFTVPPDRSPMPVMVPGMSTDEARQVRSEAAVRDGVNAVLGAFSCAPVAEVNAVLRDCARFLFTYPELDPYAAHRDAPDYLGVRMLSDVGAPPAWPEDGTPRVFAYLRANMPHIVPLLRALSECGASVLVHARGLPPQQASALRSRRFW